MGETILIVDDQRGIRLLLEELFQMEGCQTLVAENGIVALQLMQEKQVDCVLLDMKLPGMEGLEVLERMKRKWPSIPVIVMTAYEDLTLKEQVFQLGAEEYLTKPFDVFKVRDSVCSLFEN